ncbi:MAG: superoxide dismutase family protein [Chloroflexota bacterium]
MKRIPVAVLAGITALLLQSQSSSAQDGGRTVAAAAMRDQSGALVGSIAFVQQNGSVQVRAEAWSIAPGFHGFHVHSVGSCQGDFASAGGHLNRAPVGHAQHDGDMPSLFIQMDSSGSLRFETDRFTVADLFDGDGSAVIVHALPDNFGNIPTRYAPEPDTTTLNTGDSGGRVACGVVE